MSEVLSCTRLCGFQNANVGLLAWRVDKCPKRVKKGALSAYADLFLQAKVVTFTAIKGIMLQQGTESGEPLSTVPWYEPDWALESP